MDKKIVAIALLAAIIITGSSAAILLTRDDGSSDGVTETGRVSYMEMLTMMTTSMKEMLKPSTKSLMVMNYGTK
ncbi:hypothetical protein [Methanomethylophilus alvi]|uniref:hypothetical protein n=1 Tax=Methanomethylophilus alvi TaxID=1291540 RepID=UPI0037DDD75D